MKAGSQEWDEKGREGMGRGQVDGTTRTNERTDSECNLAKPGRTVVQSSPELSISHANQ